MLANQAFCPAHWSAVNEDYSLDLSRTQCSRRSGKSSCARKGLPAVSSNVGDACVEDTKRSVCRQRWDSCRGTQRVGFVVEFQLGQEEW